MKPVPPVKVRAMRMARSLASLPVQVNMTWPISAGNVPAALGIVEDDLVQIACVGVESRPAGKRLDHVRVAVPDAATLL